MSNNYDDSISVEEVKKIYNNKYNIYLQLTPKYDVFDLVDTDNKFVLEVKQRNITSDKFNTTIIGENKFIKAKEYIKQKYDIYFVIKFLDGIYQYKYNIVDKHTIRDIKGHQNGKKYVFIDINKFTKIY